MNLREFILGEMDNRKLSAREFARLVGVSHGTINNQLKFEGAPMPSVEFLFKLAEACSVDVCDLMRMIAPNDDAISTQARVLAQRIERLPPAAREILDNFIIGQSIKQSDESG